jgi:hypothetical protein
MTLLALISLGPGKQVGLNILGKSVLKVFMLVTGPYNLSAF